jgi:hypothetical protein
MYEPQDTAGYVGLGWDKVMLSLFWILAVCGLCYMGIYYLDVGCTVDRYALVDDYVREQGGHVMTVCNDLSCSGNTQGCPHVRTVCECREQDRVSFLFESENSTIGLNNGMIIEVRQCYVPEVGGWRVRGVWGARIN